MEVPQKVKKLPHGIAIPFLGINMKETKILAQKDITTPMFIAVELYAFFILLYFA